MTRIDAGNMQETAATVMVHEAQLQSALEATGIGTWVWTVGPGTVAFSPVCARLFGLSTGQASCSVDALLSRVHAEDRASVASAFGKASAGDPLCLEFRVDTEESRARWVAVSGGPIEEHASGWIGGIVSDVSKRRLAEEQLRDAHQRLEFHVQNSPLAVIEWDHEFRVMRWSPGAERLFGWSAAEVHGKHPHEWRFVHEEDTRAVDVLMDELLSGAQPRNVSRNRNYTKSGCVVHCDWQNSVLLDDCGRLRSLLSLVLDITAEVEIEKARAVVLANERHYREQLQALAHTALDLQTAASMDRLLTLATERARGIARARQSITTVHDEGHVHAVGSFHDGDEFWRESTRGREITEVLANAYPNDVSVRLSRTELDALPLARALTETCGLPRFRGLLRAPLLGRHGTMIGQIVLSDKEDGDFTEQDEAVLVQLAQIVTTSVENARLYNAELAARCEAEAAKRARDEFLAVLSHELRTPLTGILGWVGILRRTQDLDPVVVGGALDTIERCAKAQAHIVEDVLETSRIITGKLRLNLCVADLGASFGAALASVRPAAESKGITLTVEVDSEVGRIHADVDRLQQVFWNLLSNAVKFTPRGGHVQASLSRDGRDAIFQVTDDGQGMPREFLAHVFERFRQADSSATRSYGGLGLGLAITKHLVELHGGTIQAASEGPGRGSTFRVVLPNLLAAQSERPALPHERDHSDADVFLGGVRVLLVEDDPDTRDMVAALLCGTGAEVALADSVGAAMRILESSPIDVLVSDIGLPGEDGYALMTQARALFAEKSRVLPALALTAYASGDDAKRAYVAGFWAHLAKPFEAPVLMHTVARLAQQSRLCPPA